MLKLSLITPSLNQGSFVARMLESVASQSTRPFEHILFDAGSSDGTLEVLQAYEAAHDFATLHVGRDRNQTHAINLGFTESKGDIIGWLNTDDFYVSSDVLTKVVAAFETNPDVDMIYARGRFVDEQGKVLKDAFINTEAEQLGHKLAGSVGILQPASFMRRSLFDKVGKLNETLQYCMDYEYWIRIAQSGGKFLFLDDILVDATLHTDSKTIGQRAQSLLETTEMVRNRFGYAPVEWADRLADADVTGADGILHFSSDKSDALRDHSTKLLLRYNINQTAISTLTSDTGSSHVGPTLEALREAMALHNGCVVTAFDSKFFESGLTQIAQLKRHSDRAICTLVYDLGLTTAQRETLSSIEAVFVLPFPQDDERYFPGYFSGETYGFKSFAAWQVGKLVPDGAPVVWMDAGIAPIQSMTPIWQAIQNDDILLVDHNDKPNWPFLNVNFTAPAAIIAMDATREELLAPHIRAGLFGFKSAGTYQAMIDAAYSSSLSEAALQGDKHPAHTNSQQSTEAEQVRRKIGRDRQASNAYSISQIQDAYGYFGHRHDQSILSVLAARYKAPVQPATTFCVADNTSSVVSKQNWHGETVDRSGDISDNISLFYRESGAICMQHRGTYINYKELFSGEACSQVAATLDNGSPSSALTQSGSQNGGTRHQGPKEASAKSAITTDLGSENASMTSRTPTYSNVAGFTEEQLKRELESLPPDPGRKVLNPPSISIVTPNYNTADYIERTLQSVVEQDYPNLEYVVVDGNSTDGSQDIISKYHDRLSGYVSESDEGHSDALNKGFAMTSGDIMGWINSDDILLPGALNAIGELFAKYPEVEWITGQPTVIDDDGTWKLHNLRKWSRVRFLNGNYRWVQQESTFWRRSLWERAGGQLNPDVELAVDFELWTRFFREAELYTYQLPLGCFRYREGQRSKAFREAYEAEALGVIQREAASLDEDYARVFQAMFPDEIRALEYLEVGAREDQLAICDTPTITVKDMDQRGELVLPKSSSSEPYSTFRHDTAQHLLRCDDMTKYKGIHVGKRCFIMGNGPSLNETNLEKLDGEIVFGCNSVFLLFDRIKWRPTYYTCVDSRVLPDRAPDIDDMLRAHPSMTSFFPNEIVEHTGDMRRFPTRTIVPPGKTRNFFQERPNAFDRTPPAAFSTDINDHIVQPYTVAITMLQIAAYMGFSEIYLIGCDTSYTVPDDTVKEGVKADGDVGLALTSTTDDDPNHFDPRYFGAGRKWHDPQPHMMIEHHKHAYEACKALGVKVFNATVGGKLEVYPRRDFDSLFGATPAASQPTAASKAPHQSAQLIEFNTNRGADVDETAVIADLAANKKGAQHVMLDVGAHIGTSAAYFEPLGWSIHCFEPDPSNRKQLTSKFGNAPNITIDPRAVSDKPATGLQFFTSAQSTGISGLHAFTDGHRQTAIVDATTVADIVSKRGISSVDFLKIDVEGFDFSVLKGVPWDRLEPDIIECEFEDKKTVPLGHTWRDISAYLVDKGYSVYVSEWHPIVRYGISHDWRRIVPVAECEMSENAWGNLLAFKNDPGIKVISEAFAARINKRPKAVEASHASNSEKGKLSMLKQTPPHMIDREAPLPGTKWYSASAMKLKDASPRLFQIIKFARRTVAHALTRPQLLLPLLVLLGVFVWISFSPATAATRGFWLLGLGGAVLTVALGYIAQRAFAHAEALHIETTALKHQTALLQAQLTSTQKVIGKTDQRIQTRIYDLTAQQAKAAGIRADFEKLSASLHAQIAALNTRLADTSLSNEVKQEIAETAAAQKAELDRVMAQIGQAQQGLAALQQKVNAVQQANSEASQKADAVSTEVDKFAARLDASEKFSTFDNAKWYQHFNRNLSYEQIHLLENSWRKRLSVPINRALLGYMADRVCRIERELDGRLATTVEDMLLRTLVAKAVKGSSVSVLEIGTLFGTGAAIMYDGLRGNYKDIHFTLLDPLEGYYHGSQSDILTGQVVDEAAVRRNLAKVGMDDSEFTLIKHLSIEPEAMETAALRQYDVLVIDGDHSYAGVKTDFENYAKYVKVGGYIIFDDYSSPDWPDVQAYVDAEIGNVDFVAPVGSSWRTCVFRVVKAPVTSRAKKQPARPRPTPKASKTPATTDADTVSDE